MTVTYDKFFPEVLPYVHDCPDLVALNAIRNSCIEFCDKSLYLQYIHDPITVIRNVGEYELDLPRGMVASRITDGWLDNLPLVPKSADELRAIFSWNWQTITGQPQYYTQTVPTHIIIAPLPQVTTTAQLRLTITMTPTRDSTGIEDVIWQRWAEAIGFGARARLYATPGQPYADEAQANKYRTWFESAIGEAKIERNRGLTRTTLYVRPPSVI